MNNEIAAVLQWIRIVKFLKYGENPVEISRSEEKRFKS